MASASQTNLLEKDDTKEENGKVPVDLDKNVQQEPQNNSSNNVEDHAGYKMYKRRWFGIAVIVALNISTAFAWLNFNAVSEISETWLNASLSEINLSVTLYFLGSIVTSSFSGYVFETWGIKTALLVGGGLNMVGSWTKYFASFIESTEESHEARLVVVLIGQFIAACAQPFFLNVPPKYSAMWFSDSSRVLGTTIGTISNPVGAAVAMVVIPALCSNTNGDDMPLTLLVIGIISIVTAVPAFFIPNEPPTPPSPSAEIALAEARDESFWFALKKVSRNTQFWILCAAFSIFVAIFNAISSLINQIAVPYGYTDDDAGLFGASMIAAGLIGAAACGIYVDRTKQHKMVLKLAAPFLAAGYIGLVFVIQEDAFAWICLVCAFLGFVSFALLPVALELGVECTYPCPPSTSTSVLWMGGQTVAIIFLNVGDTLRDKSPFSDEPEDTYRTGLICVAAVATLTTLLAFVFNSPNYRMEAEAEQRAKTANAAQQISIASTP